MNHAEAEMSNQAMSVLRQFVQSGAKEFIKYVADQGTELILLDAKDKTLVIEDHRFIDDDLNTLVSHEFLTRRRGSGGDEIYGITRAAASFIERD